MYEKETLCTCGDDQPAAVMPLVTAMPMIGDEAPVFEAETTMGKITFPDDYRGKWVILFSHPADFTPVCTSEIAMFSTYADTFKKMNTELLGISVDSVGSHLAWIKNIEDKIEYKGHKNFKINFPIIADIKMDVAKKFGMIQPHASDTKAVRAVFFIDPEGIVRASILYPLSTGRNLDEIQRVLTALQTTDKYGVSTPANWMPGDDVVMGAPTTKDEMVKRAEKSPKGASCEDWFFCLRKLDS